MIQKFKSSVTDWDWFIIILSKIFQLSFFGTIQPKVDFYSVLIILIPQHADDDQTECRESDFKTCNFTLFIIALIGQLSGVGHFCFCLKPNNSTPHFRWKKTLSWQLSPIHAANLRIFFCFKISIWFLLNTYVLVLNIAQL